MSPSPETAFKPVVLVLVIPVLALLSSVLLPFVNTPTRWLGVPAIFVWASAWVIAITPLLLLVERALHPRGSDEEAAR